MHAEQQGDIDTATRLYRIAAMRSPRDLGTHAWLAAQALKSGDFGEALLHFDRMLRVQPEISAKLNKVMIPLAMERRAQAPLVELLAAGPTWRQDFTLPLIREAPDRVALFKLMQELGSKGNGLEAPEHAAWLDRLAFDREWSQAYLIWAGALTAEQSREIGNVYNGRFEAEPSGIGFDWRFGRIAGARIFQSQTAGARGQALGVAFEDQRVPFEHVRQLLALPAGKYRFSGRARLDDLRTERGLIWTLQCADGGAPIMETQPFRGTRGWDEFSVDFEVPEAGCPGQWLVLRLPARIPAEQRIGGTAWFDDLKISAVRG
jgi:tetratricopeptide (TPR) repeat protein